MSLEIEGGAPEPGDIIKFERGTFAHFGIYEGDGYLIHKLPDKKKGKVCRDKISDVKGPCRAKKNNHRDKTWTPYEKSEIVKRARDKIGNSTYGLVLDNCEHFVNDCRYGKHKSDQVDDTVEVVVPVVVNAVKAAYTVAPRVVTAAAPIVVSAAASFLSGFFRS